MRLAQPRTLVPGATSKVTMPGGDAVAIASSAFA
jgi:hypothetical protein